MWLGHIAPSLGLSFLIYGSRQYTRPPCTKSTALCEGGGQGGVVGVWMEKKYIPQTEKI